jgi:hypothetical protein
MVSYYYFNFSKVFKHFILLDQIIWIIITNFDLSLNQQL